MATILEQMAEIKEAMELGKVIRYIKMDDKKVQDLSSDCTEERVETIYYE